MYCILFIKPDTGVVRKQSGDGAYINRELSALFQGSGTAHKKLNASKAVQQHFRDYATQRRTRDILSSKAPPRPATACSLLRLAPNNNFQTACANKDTTNSESRYRYPSTSSRLVGARAPLRRYDVQTACQHVRTKGKSQHTSFQKPFIRKRTHLPHYCELNSFCSKQRNCDYQKLSLQNVAGEIIPRTTSSCRDILAVVQRPARFAYLENPVTANYHYLDRDEHLFQCLLPSRLQCYCFSL